MGVSTYAVAVHTDEALCVRVNSLVAGLFVALSVFTVVQILRLWLAGSKLSSRKIVFLHLLLGSCVRAVWYGLSAAEVLPYETEAGNGFELVRSDWDSVTSHYAYLFPMAQLFTACSWIILNWFQLYQKEKLRRKMQPILSSSLNSTPIDRRLKSERKERQLFRVGNMFTLSVHACAMLLAILSVGFDAHFQGNNMLSQIPPETILACLCLALTVALGLYAFRYLANLKLARSSDSHKLKHHTIFSLALMLSVLSYFIFLIGCYLAGVFEATYDPILDDFVNADGLNQAHVLLRVFEALQALLIVTTLASDRLSLRAPFPAKVNAITSDWLTSVLQENGTIKSTTTVIAFSTETLYGGCHFKVVRVSLRYSVEKPDDPHKTIVVKLLYWDKTIWDRIFVYMRYLFHSLEKEPMYLRSYRVEHEFYKSGLALGSLRIPQIYYNHEDCFNNRFGMILEDLSSKDDGQPHGFTADQSRVILSALAEFHAIHFRNTPKDIAGWKVAGYWTDIKRKAKKKKIARSWEKVVNNFPELELRNRYDSFGRILLAKLKWLWNEMQELLKPEYQTLCHGDFKISNLFISRPKPAKEQSVFVIDYQWFGRGNGLIDATYFLYTSLCEKDLGTIGSLHDHYYTELLRHGVEYPREVFQHHRRVVLTDFCLYAICSKWCGMTQVEFRENQQKQKDGLHLRSIPHLETILDDVYSIVSTWDEDEDKDSDVSSDDSDGEDDTKIS